MALLTPDPPALPDRWHDILTRATGEGVRVAVLDSGWDYSMIVPGLRLEPGVSFAEDGTMSEPCKVPDLHGHGTACITTLISVAPRAAICPIRVFDRVLLTSRRAVTRAIEWAVAQQFDVVSLSLSTEIGTGVAELYRACARASEAGTIVVAAAERECPDHVPAAFDNVLSVGRTTQGGPFDFEACTHDRIDCRVVAGIRGRVIGLGGEVWPAENASFAAPVIAGVVALLRTRYGPATLPSVRTLLKRLAVPCTVCTTGAPRRHPTTLLSEA